MTISVYLLTFDNDKKYVALSIDQPWEVIHKMVHSNGPFADVIKSHKEAGTIDVCICYRGTSYSKARVIKHNYIDYYQTTNPAYGYNVYDVELRPDEKTCYIYCPQRDEFYTTQNAAARTTGYSRQRIHQIIGTSHRTKQGYSFEWVSIGEIPDFYFTEEKIYGRRLPANN